MVYYLATTGYTHPLETFLTHWRPDLAPRIRAIRYDGALGAEELPLGTYVFSDLERLLPSETQIAELVWNQLHAAGARLLNHPTRTLKRYELLTKMHALGRNRFRAVRAGDRDAGLHYPVFIRDESGHDGSISKLLQTPRELEKALAGAVVRGHRLKNLLVVEYLETVGSDDLYRKYAAFSIGGRIVPGHIDCSRNWMVKDTDLVDPDVLARERDYLETNPHREWLEETFALAGTDYGRMDYSLIDGTPQLWEINTNPILILKPTDYSEAHLPTKQFLAGSLFAALESLDTVRSDDRVRISVPAALYTRLELERKRRRWALSHQKAFRRLKKSASFRAFRRLVHPLLGPLAPLLTRSGRSDPDR